MSWKCCLTSIRCAFGSLFSASFMLVSWSSVSSRNNVLLVVASTFTASHISCKVLRFLILLPRWVEVVERMTCWARFVLVIVDDFYLSSLNLVFHSLGHSICENGDSGNQYIWFGCNGCTLDMPLQSLQPQCPLNTRFIVGPVASVIAELWYHKSCCVRIVCWECWHHRVRISGAHNLLNSICSWPR